MGEAIPTSNGNADGTKEKKQLILNAFVMNTPGHLSPGLWKHPRNKTADYKKLKFWTDLAQLLDNNFHAMFVADVLGPYVLPYFVAWIKAPIIMTFVLFISIYIYRTRRKYITTQY